MQIEGRVVARPRHPSALQRRPFPAILLERLNLEDCSPLKGKIQTQTNPYGTIKDIKPACIDLTTRRFKVAGHAITGFDAVRVKNTSTGVWEEKGFASTDNTQAEFTLASGDWADGKEVAVDFTGLPADKGSVRATVNGTPHPNEEMKQWLHRSPFIESKYGSGVITINTSRGTLVLDKNGAHRSGRGNGALPVLGAKQLSGKRTLFQLNSEKPVCTKITGTVGVNPRDRNILYGNLSGI